MKREDGSLSKDGFIEWATMGMADTLGSSVRDVGEVIEHVGHDPLKVQVRRTSMLLKDEVVQNEWSCFDLLCPVQHCRVDLSVGMRIGVYVKPCQRLQVGQVYADASVPLWNLPQHDLHLAWNASHLFAGAYEGWLRAMWWLQQTNLGYSFASHTSVDWCPEVMKTWSFNHGKGVQKFPIEIDFNSQEVFTGICADISEVTLL